MSVKKEWRSGVSSLSSAEKETTVVVGGGGGGGGEKKKMKVRGRILAKERDGVRESDNVSEMK